MKVKVCDTMQVSVCAFKEIYVNQESTHCYMWSKSCPPPSKNFVGAQLHSFIRLLSMTVFHSRVAPLSSCNTTVWPQKLTIWPCKEKPPTHFLNILEKITLWIMTDDSEITVTISLFVYKASSNPLPYKFCVGQLTYFALKTKAENEKARTVPSPKLWLLCNWTM